jgi:hypothetical protein
MVLSTACGFQMIGWTIVHVSYIEPVPIVVGVGGMSAEPLGTVEKSIPGTSGLIRYQEFLQPAR